MTAFEEIQVGDKIRATHHETGDVCIGVVENRPSNSMVQTATTSIIGRCWRVEILEKAMPKLPTGHLAMVGAEGRTPYVRVYGGWSDVTHNSARPVDDSVVQRALARGTFRVLYEGLPQ